MVQAAVDLRIMHPEPSLLTIVCMAQEQVLPENRRRALATISAVPAIVAGIKEGLLESCTSSSPLVEIEVPRVEYRQEPGELAARRLSNTELYVEVARRLASAFEAKTQPTPMIVPESVAKAVFPRSEGVEPVADTPRRAVVAVVGLLPAQQNEVREKAKGFTNLDVVFLAKSQRPKIPLRVQYCIVQRHNGHRWFDKAQAQLGNKNVFFEPGGETGILRKLANLNSQVH